MLINKFWFDWRWIKLGISEHIVACIITLIGSTTLQINHHTPSLFPLTPFEDWNRNRSWVWNSPYGRIWRRLLDWFFIFLVKHLYSSHHTKVTVIMMILFFSPNHWNSKIKQSSSPISPLTQVFFTVFADKMGNLLFILITKLNTKRSTIRVFIKLV